MKSSLILFIVVCGGIAGTVFYFNREKNSTVTTPVVQSPPSLAKKIQAPETKQEQPQTISPSASEPPQVTATTPASSDAKSDNTTNSTALSKAIDALVSPQTSYQQRQAVLRQLRDSGQIDQAIEALKQGAVNNPASATYPTVLGEAELQKAGLMYINGGNPNETATLAMQADQSFDAALKLDPSNWEAQFSKAAAMSYWPVNLSGSQVIQQFSSLIDQQETMPSQPQFAQTYVLLGNEFQKMGQPDKAVATWVLGAQKFPNDPTLQKKVNGQ
jgi:tetratricopeptide (TPR) repeat protein